MFKNKKIVKIKEIFYSTPKKIKKNLEIFFINKFFIQKF